MKRTNIKKLVAFNKQRGVSIVELLIWLALAALVIIGGVVGANSFIAGNKTKQETEELPVIFTKIQKVYSQAASYNGITLGTLISNRVFPQDRVTSATTATNRFGGAVTVAAANITGTDDGAALTYSAVPEEGCIDLASAMARSAAKISVDATVVKAIGGTLNVATLGTQCNDSSSNSMEFVIGR